MLYEIIKACSNSYYEYCMKSERNFRILFNFTFVFEWFQLIYTKTYLNPVKLPLGKENQNIAS